MSVLLRKYWPLKALALLVIVVYAQSLTNGFVNLDDPLLITENPTVQSLSLHNLVKAFTTFDPELYIPFTLISYQIEIAIFGMHPIVFHLTNLLLHLANTLLVFAIFRMLGQKQWTAWCIAAFFALHPIQTEAVVWASARKDLLSSFFGLGSITLYLRYRMTGYLRLLGYSLAAFTFGMLSKVGILLLPFALLCIDWKEHRKMKTALVEKVPYFILSAIFLIIAIIGKSHALDDSTFAAKIFLAIKSAVFSLEKIIFPVHLSAMYQYTDNLALLSSNFLIPFSVLCVLGILLILSKRISRDIIAGAGIFLAFLLPAFATFSKGSEMYITSDRYVYMAMIGILLTCTSFLSFISKKMPQLKQSLVIAVIVLLICCGYLSHARSVVWANSESFYQDVLTSHPQDVHARYNLAIALRDDGRNIEAAEQLLALLKIDPNHVDSLIDLGILFTEQNGNTDEAEQKFRDVVKHAPHSARAHENLGVILLARGKTQDAIAEFESALEIDPNYSIARHALAEAYGSIREFEKAIEQYRLLQELDPAYAASIKLPELE